MQWTESVARYSMVIMRHPLFPDAHKVLLDYSFRICVRVSTLVGTDQQGSIPSSTHPPHPAPFPPDDVAAPRDLEGWQGAGSLAELLRAFDLAQIMPALEAFGVEQSSVRAAALSARLKRAPGRCIG
jgi:hypothetical protein